MNQFPLHIDSGHAGGYEEDKHFWISPTGGWAGGKFKFNPDKYDIKSCDVRNRDWDVHLPYLLFAFRMSVQESTKESPFFLMNG